MCYLFLIIRFIEAYIKCLILNYFIHTKIQKILVKFLYCHCHLILILLFLMKITEEYGIMGIPHIMLIGADGVIKARGIRGPKIKEAIEAELAK